MKNEIEEILKDIKEEFCKFRKSFEEEKNLNAERHNQLQKSLVEEKSLNVERYKSFTEERALNAERYKSFTEEKDLNSNRFNQLLKIFKEEQGLCAQRYHELKSSIEDVKNVLPSLATKDQLNRVFESLSQDITYVSGDHHKLKKRVSHLEKRVGKLEDRVS